MKAVGVKQDHAWVHLDESGQVLGGCRPTRAALVQMAKDSGNYYEGCTMAKIHGLFRFPKELFLHDTAEVSK